MVFSLHQLRQEMANKTLNDGYGNYIGLSFTEWMNLEYGDDWPTSDEDNSIWHRYLEYVKEEMKDGNK